MPKELVKASELAKEVLDLDISSTDVNVEFYDGSLGTFSYDTTQFRIMEDHNETVLKYIGGASKGIDINIPEGIRDCSHMFSGNKKLISAPAIPNTVVKCYHMFQECTSLTEPPVIPESVTDCGGMFLDCANLRVGPEIPNGVISCSEMFAYSGIEEAPWLPDSVIYSDYMFLNRQ